MKNIEQQGLILRFSIANPTIQPTEGRWNATARISIEGRREKIPAIIETVVLEEDRKQLRIAARIPKGSSHNIQFDSVWIVSQLPSPETTRLDEGFFKKMQADSNGRKVIETLYGGQFLDVNDKVDEDAIFFFPSTEPIVLNQFQNYYISMILADVPLVLGNSPFGCGKSMTIVTAAIELHKRNNRFNKHGKHRQQLLVTQTNNAGVSLVEIARRVKGVQVNFLRYISETNWKVLPDASRTVYDMPSLMQDMFVGWATESSDPMIVYSQWSRHHKNAIVRKVTQNYIDPGQLHGEARLIFQNLMNYQKTTEPSPRVLREAFFLAYQPDVIVTTADSLHALVQSEILKYIANVQIDEASQLPEHSLVYLLQEFPNAGFGLVGDIKQLPPHCDNLLNNRLKEYGIGNTMERALEKGMFPKSILRYVYRCHPVTTQLLSDLFYDGNLICGVEENDRNEFMRMRADIWPNSKFPILVLNHEGRSYSLGTSVANEDEKIQVVRIVKCLTQEMNGYQLKEFDIGIISFYRAQTSLLTEAFRGTDVKCGTIDAFQGTEKEVMIVCCTNEKPSEFMKLANRVNVAMSRARQATIIIGNVSRLREAQYWSTIVKKSQKNNCLIYEVSRFGCADHLYRASANDSHFQSGHRHDESGDDDDSPDNSYEESRQSVLSVEERSNKTSSDEDDSEAKPKMSRRRGGRRRGGRNKKNTVKSQEQNVDKKPDGTAPAGTNSRKRRERRKRAAQRKMEQEAVTPANQDNKRNPRNGQKERIPQEITGKKESTGEESGNCSGGSRPLYAAVVQSTSTPRNRGNIEKTNGRKEPKVQINLGSMVDQLLNLNVSNAQSSVAGAHDDEEHLVPGRRRRKRN